jgi:hypothetical protein
MAVVLKTHDDAELIAFAERWIELLVAADYSQAFAQLLYRSAYPGKSWCDSADDLKAWISGYGTNTPEADEPVHRVTHPSNAQGDPISPEIFRDSKLYSGQVVSLDCWLPLDGEWSDLMASFDFVQKDGGVSPVLRALRIP